MPRRNVGFRTAAAVEGAPRWVWRGIVRAKIAPAPRDNAFAALAGLGSSLG